MPLDQSIIQAGLPPSLSQADLMAPQLQQQKLAESQADTQTKQLAAKQAQMNMDAQRALDSALSDATVVGPDGKATVDWDKAHGSLAQMGYGRAALQADQMAFDATQRAFQTKQDQLKYQGDVIHAASSVAGAIPDVDETEPDQTKLAAQKGVWQASVLRAIPTLVGLGAIDPATAGQYQQMVAQQGWTPEMGAYVKQMAAQGETAEQHAEDLHRQVADAKLRALLPTEVAEADTKRAGQILSSATSPEEYTRLMQSLKTEGINPMVLEKFPQQWTPQTPDTALRLAMSPTEIAKLPSRTATAVKTELANAITSFNAQKPTDDDSYATWLKAQPASVQALLPAEYSDDVADQVASLGKKPAAKASGIKLTPNQTLIATRLNIPVDHFDKLTAAEAKAINDEETKQAVQVAGAKAAAVQATKPDKSDASDKDTKKAVLAAFEPALDSGERFNVMTQNYEDAVKNHDQQAMLSLLANHLGMTMGLQKGSRLTRDIINEAETSRPWLQGMESKFDKNGYLTGVNLTPEQMRQMVSLGRNRFAEDISKARNKATYIGSTDDGPARTPSKATINHYLGLTGGDVAKAKQLATADGWTIK